MLIDTHCHFNFEAFASDRDAIWQEALAHGVRRLINPAVDLESGAQALELAARYDGVYAAVGIHPNYTANYTPSLLDQIAAQAAQPKCVAIGEIGLDYYWDESPKAQQWRAFEDQLTLAARLGLPVIIHNREATADLLRILSAWQATLSAEQRARIGVLHSFSASSESAEQALALGFYLGFSGPITYKKADALRAVAAQVPLERLLIETDAPYLTPHPHRGQRNVPAHVRYVAEQLAALHRCTFEQLAQQTTRNAELLFNLPMPGTLR
ncbi:MAG: hydrolase TatD [Candidatus Thermofonsia Clade 1 bacterium]|jgi:TatD DNase family protein|uniref:Hydrolase TatD n=1 Tax=Candidatus Thermofonsia Clade 1 bacterium TaxID=2364210 RepID=A0A2M8PBB6_9CHLR|nr:MAG: hydrolase TatD [Candidatus Thermofonsia Clade 1 bacterium]RMF50294.1 MAG: TatD family deoxyribonuclease [Chloroflexota bacterium]